MAIEPYDITTDLSDQDIYSSVLHQDALDAGLSTLTSVDSNAKGYSNKVRFHFPSPLSGPDKTTLDGVVAAYDPASTQPVLDSTAAVILEDVDASATERVWALTTDTATGTATFGTCSDAGAPSDPAWEATRTGETVGLFDVKVPMAVAGEVTALDPTSGPALTTRTFMEGYVDARVQGINWQDAVISETLTTPPGSPTLGDRYLIPTGATGAWASNVDDLTEWDDVEWVMTTPVDGMTVPINDIGRTRRHNGTSWGSLGSTIAHANTIGLTTGDAGHTQLQLRSEKGSASGYAGLTAGLKLTGSWQVYGTAANTACVGNDSRLSNARTPTTHGLGGSEHSSATLAQLNALVSDATLDTSSASRTPSTHATSHSDGGSDEITIENLATSGASGKVPTSDGAGGLTMETPAGGVFGTELALDESLSESGLSTSFVERMRIPSTGDVTMPAGTYLLSFTCTWRYEHSTNRFEAKLLQDAVQIGELLNTTSASTSSSQRNVNTKNVHVVLTAGDYNWSLEVRKSSSGTAAVYETYMSIYRIA